MRVCVYIPPTNMVSTNFLIKTVIKTLICGVQLYITNEMNELPYNS